MADVLAVDPAAPAAEALARGAAVLRAGGLVAFPTETFYGLGAAGLHAGAVRALFAAKGRPDDKPVLLLVDSLAMAERVAEVSPVARRLMERYWPGPLTLVLPARAGVPDEVTASTGTVGLRLSPHPVARGLVRALGEPVTAPSANRSGAVPPTSAGQVLRELGEAIALVLDGGPTPGGLPSTVLDLTAHPPRVLRPGPVRVEVDSA